MFNGMSQFSLAWVTKLTGPGMLFVGLHLGGTLFAGPIQPANWVVVAKNWQLD